MNRWVIVSCFFGFVLLTSSLVGTDENPPGQNTNAHQPTPPTNPPPVPTTSKPQDNVTNNTNPAPPPTSVAPETIGIYIGAGALIVILLVIFQIICICVYTKKVKETQHSIETLIRYNAQKKVNTGRYSVLPVTKREACNDEDVYESLTDLNKTNKKPAPPPIETLPRKDKSPSLKRHQTNLPQTPAIPRIQDNTRAKPVQNDLLDTPRVRERLPTPTDMKHPFHGSSSMPRNRDRMPIPAEPPSFHCASSIPRNRGRIPIPPETPLFHGASSMTRNKERVPIPPEKSSLQTSSMPRSKERRQVTPEVLQGDSQSSIISRSRMPLPHEPHPIGHSPLPTRKLQMKTAPALPHENNIINQELVAKLKRRAALNETPDNNQPIHRTTFSKQRKRDSTDSEDDEWTFEPIKQINLYNI